jgi:Uma2 family endonuclease
MALPVTPPAATVYYPDSDGRPVAESEFQLIPFLYAVDALRTHFRARNDVYVAGNMFIYYEEGNPRAAVAPDIFVVVGASKHVRPSYKLWEEPKAPDFVLEITSHSTRSEDQGAKRGIYAFLGVREYFQYDPTGDYLLPPLKGFRLLGDNYQPLPATTLPDGTLVLRSDALGLELRIEDGTLRFYDPASGKRLLTHQEAEQARREAEQARQEAEARAQAAEARVAELEARLRALQAEPPATSPPPTRTDP